MDIEAGGKYKIVFHKRDFMAGATVVENIQEALRSSKTTLVLLSPHFVASPWCLYEAREAVNLSVEEARRVIVLVVLTHTPFPDIPACLHTYMTQNTYIEWKPDEVGIKLFWRNIEVALNKPFRV